jgi:hypothetical protein
MRRLLPSAFLFAAVMVTPAGAGAQDAPPTAPPGQVETELVFEREVFQYPAFTRANPFRPLLSSDAGGPRFEDLRLSGIIYSETASHSVAIFNTSAITVAEDRTLSAVLGDSYAVKVGQTVGNITVVEITLESVVVDVEEFGITDRRTMRPLNLLGGNQ